MLQGLLVEDDAGVADVVKGALEHFCEVSVTSADTGASAVQALGLMRFDFAVIDIRLPDISGFDLANQAAHRNVPVLLMSGHPEEQELCRLASYPHLNKPFSLSALEKSAKALLHDAQRNIDRVQRSNARLTAAYEQAKRNLAESKQVIGDSRRIRAESISILAGAVRRHQPRLKPGGSQG
jgi:DNA-binding response OmpR family regulator